MDYKERYELALERARQIHSEHKAQSFDVLRDVFPELAESEDEKIRKVLIGWINLEPIEHFEGGFTKEQILTWLEKQGEQKPIEMKSAEESLGISSEEYNKIVDDCVYGEQKPMWSNEDKIGLIDALACVDKASEVAKDENDMGNAWYAERWLKSLRDRCLPQPKQEWGEKDERCKNAAINACSQMIENYENSTRWYEDAISWLKSLRPQKRWKQSR